MKAETQPQPRLTPEEMAEMQKKSQQEKVAIPPQYANMPSELVEEMLGGGAMLADPEKQKAELDRREKIVEAVRQKELAREQGKDKMYAGLYAELPEDKKKVFSQRLSETSKQLSEYAKGNLSLDGLSSEEQAVLGKVKSAFEAFQKEKPGQEFKFKMSKEIDQRVLGNLQYKLAFESFRETQTQGDKQKADEILAGIQGEQKEGTKVSLIENEAVDPAMVDNEKPVDSRNINKGEQIGSFEKEEIFKEQVGDFLQLALKDKDFRGLMDKYRNTKFASESEEMFKERQALSDVEVLTRMTSSMYDLIHKSGMSYQEVVNGINVPNKEEFIRNFNDEISGRLVDAVSQSSKVRHITEQELIQGKQADQAAGYVWFKGNAPRPKDAREVRFYINASPDGTTKTAEYLSKLSDQLDQYGLRLQFKFRKDLGEYDRTDTCVAYLYMPKAETAEQKANSDQWLERVKETMAKIPKDAVRNKNSFFTDKIGEGVSFAEDTRETGSKKGESYTSQITKAIGESSGEVAKQFRDLTPEAMEQITLQTVEKLKKLNYF